MNERPLIGVGVILQNGTKVLLGYRKNSHGSGTWCFPGGHLEFGEGIFDCAARELLEETGLTSSKLTMATFTNDIFPEEKKHYVTIFVVAEYQGGSPQLREPEKCQEWGWFEWNELPSPLFIPINNLIAQGFNP